jgi:hypothetical protein
VTQEHKGLTGIGKALCIDYERVSPGLERCDVYSALAELRFAHINWIQITDIRVVKA